MVSKRIRGSVAALAIAMLVSACGGSDTAAPAPAPVAPAPEAPGSAPEPEVTCETLDLSTPPAQPVKIRIGHGFAAEEPFWLMAASPEVTQYAGSWYEVELFPFRGTEERLQTYQAGELEGVIISPQAQIRGTAVGALSLYAIVTVMREAEPTAYSGTFISLEGSGIESAADLRGKRIAVVDIGSHWDFLARSSVALGGLDPDSDVEYVVLPFPAQEEALRNGQIDVAGLPEPLYSLAFANGGVQDVVSADQLTDYAYDLLQLSFTRSFVDDNFEAMCAWRLDFQSSMAAYRADRDGSRTALSEAGFVSLPLPIYLQTGDYARPEGGIVDTAGMAQMLETMIEFGILTEQDRIDVNTLVRPGLSAGH
jgi:ABC-type nitrate/sulfonate/bicarbonate transport system substrate-binding protein